MATIAEKKSKVARTLIVEVDADGQSVKVCGSKEVVVGDLGRKSSFQKTSPLQVFLEDLEMLNP